MGQTTDQIEAHIENTREELGSNLQELEHKVKSVTDWRQHFRANPMTMMGAAFGGGVLLAAMMGSSSRPRHRRRPESGGYSIPEPRSIVSQKSHQAMETLDNIRGALIGVAATRFKDFVGELVPGFREHFDRTEQNSHAMQR
jgi:hypothetical protein